MPSNFKNNLVQKLRNPANIIYLIVYTGISLLGILLAKFSTTTGWQSLGIGLIGSGICGHVSFLYLVASEDIKEKVQILSKYGFIKALPSRSVTIQKEYDDLLQKMRFRLDILAYGLSKFYDDHVNNGDLEKWSKNVPIRILLIDPEYPTRETSFAMQRDLEERSTNGKIKSQVDEFLAKVHPLLKDTNSKLEVRLSKVMPSINIFRVDNKMFFGPYLAGEPSHNSPTFIIKEHGVLFSRYEKHFLEIWNHNEFSRDALEYLNETED